jgi:ribosomal protein S6
MTLQRTRTYECMCLLDNREVRKGWQPLKDAVAGIFTKHGAKILSSRRWDERRLAYAVNGQHRGTYLLVYFSCDTSAVAGRPRHQRVKEAGMRNLLVDCAEIPQGAYEPEAAFDVNAIPADDAPPAPAPEPVAAAPAEAGPVADTPTEA